MLKHAVYGIVVFLSVLFPSCDDEPSDDQKPTIEVEILQNGIAVDAANLVRGIITLKARAEDNQKVKSIALFVNDQRIKEGTDVQILESSLDTRMLDDKVHTIKVTVEDNAGNTSELTTDLTTKNVFLRCSVPSHSREQWVVVSDKDGKVLDYKKINNATYVFLYPLEFIPDNVDYTVIQCDRINPQHPRFYASTLKNIPSGDYIIPPSPPGEQFKGQYSVLIEGQSAFDFNLVPGEPSFHSWGPSNLMTVLFGESPIDLFICFANTKYIYKPLLGTGQSLIINQGFIDTQMIPLSGTVISNNGVYSFDVSGIRADGSLRPFVNSGDGLLKGDINVKYPLELKGNGFADFLTTIGYERTEGAWNVHHEFSERGIPSALSELQATLSNLSSFNPDNIKLQFAGSADRIYLDYYYIDYNSSTNSFLEFSWEVRMAFFSSVDTKLPELPSDLLFALGLKELPAIGISRVTLVSTSLKFTDDHYQQMFFRGNTNEYDASEKHIKRYVFDWEDTGG